MSPVRHPVVCLDLDHTLLDSDTSEAMSFDATLREAGVDDPSVHLQAFLTINSEMWAAVERGEMDAADVRLARFRRFVSVTGVDVDPANLADSYARGLAVNGDLYPGALTVLEDLSDLATLALVTNGVSDIQRARIERLGLGPFFDTVVISSEIGASKPAAAFFDTTFRRLGVSARDGALMVGDSLSADMKGGIDYGLATCWFNRNGVVGDVPVTYEIARLDELPAIVRG